MSYSKTEIVDHVNSIEHPSVREALRYLGIEKGIEIVSISDIPSRGTGLGSSSSFLVGLLHALHSYKGEFVSSDELAREAVKIEREILREEGGETGPVHCRTRRNQPDEVHEGRERRYDERNIPR